MKECESELSSRYYIAEGSIWLLGAIMFVARFLGLAPDQALPILGITPQNGQYIPRVLAILLLAAVLYLAFEWNQSSRPSRTSVWQSIRLVVTGLWAAASLWIAYPLITYGTVYSGISPAWYLGFITIGLSLGILSSTVVFSALMIRSPQEAKSLHLPRIPVATKSVFALWLPIILLLLLTYYVLLFCSPLDICWIGGCLVVIPIIVRLTGQWSSLCLAQDKDGMRIPYRQHIAQLRTHFDSHDYSYLLIDQHEQFTNKLGGYLHGPPQEMQKYLRAQFASPSDSGPIPFRIQLLDRPLISCFPKDGNPNNLDPHNRGFKIRNSEGSNDALRALMLMGEPVEKPREISLPINLIVTYAEEYLACHTLEEDLTFQKILSFALNQSATEVIVKESKLSLTQVAYTGDADGVKLLIAQGADVNEKVEFGWTALLAACAQGYPQIARVLLDAGANPDIGNVHGITPLMYGARYGNKNICAVLLEYGASINLQDKYGMTALFVAARDGHLSIVEFLLKAGADPKAKTFIEKTTALDVSYQRGHGKIAKAIKKALGDNKPD